jgi:hypothetical protein
MMTTYERGKLEGHRESLLLLLEKKFGPLSSEVKQRVQALLPDQVRQLQLDVLTAQSLKDLQLED